MELFGGNCEFEQTGEEDYLLLHPVLTHSCRVGAIELSLHLTGCKGMHLAGKSGGQYSNRCFRASVNPVRRNLHHSCKMVKSLNVVSLRRGRNAKTGAVAVLAGPRRRQRHRV
jgi:hypothetical protein